MLTHVNCHQQHWPSAMCLNCSYRVLLVSVVLLIIIVGWLLLIFYFAILVTTLLCCHHPTALWCCKQNYCCCLPLLLLSLLPVDCLLQFLVSYFVLWLLLLDKNFVLADFAILPVLLQLQAVPAFTAPCTAALLMPLLLLLAFNIDIVSGHQLIVASFCEYAMAVAAPTANASTTCFCCYCHCYITVPLVLGMPLQ